MRLNLRLWPIQKLKGKVSNTACGKKTSSQSTSHTHKEEGYTLNSASEKFFPKHIRSPSENESKRLYAVLDPPLRVKLFRIGTPSPLGAIGAAEWRVDPCSFGNNKGIDHLSSIGVLNDVVLPWLKEKKKLINGIASSGKKKSYCAEYILHRWMEPYRFMCDGVEER